MRYLAIDYGKKRTGLAICDPSETIVSPLTILIGQDKLIEKIVDIARREGAEAVVVGLPLNMDNSEGGQAKLVRKFAEKLGQSLDIPLFFQDERLSSYGAEQKMLSVGFSQKKMAGRLDAIAAAEILTAYLEKKNPALPEENPESEMPDQ